MKKIKVLFIFLIIIFIIAVGSCTISSMIGPTSKATELTTEVSQADLTALENTIKLRLANQLVKGMANGDSQIAIALAPEEISPLIHAQIKAVKLPKELQLVGSSFTINNKQGALELSLLAYNRLKLGLTVIFNASYENDHLIFQLAELKLGRFTLSDGMTRQLIDFATKSHAQANPNLFYESKVKVVEPEISLGPPQPIIFLEEKEIHLPIDFIDNNLSLANIYFSSPNQESKHGALVLEFAVNTKSIQEQLLNELRKVIPPHLFPKVTTGSKLAEELEVYLQGNPLLNQILKFR
ncbi:MAG: hypothetical protein SCK28_10695 [Bacillota bacterium]|nr:hypothetical protein [Bacillota bacterium]